MRIWKRIPVEKIDDVQALKSTLLDVIESFLEIVELIDDFDKTGDLREEAQELVADLNHLRKDVIKEYGPN